MSSPSDLPSTSFTCTLVNDTTYLIIEDDSYAEHPFIYAKLHPKAPLLILSDTGCNSPRDKSVKFSHLRTFIETYPIKENNNRPLNPVNGGNGKPEREYMVICTHCHYDHIGGIEAFAKTASTQIVASAHGKEFIQHDLDKHSLCHYIGIPLPKYSVSIWAKDSQRLTYRDQDLGITILNTPGHLPDELAWYDIEERWLYVGDSFYVRGEDDMPILFDSNGNWTDFQKSMNGLLEFVRGENEPEESAEGWEILGRPVKIGAGHQTSKASGEEMLEEVIRLFEGIIAGKVPVVSSGVKRGEVNDMWREEGKDVKFSVAAPRRLAEEARRALCRRMKW